MRADLATCSKPAETPWQTSKRQSATCFDGADRTKPQHNLDKARGSKLDKTAALKTRLAAVSVPAASLVKDQDSAPDFGSTDESPPDDVATPMKALELAVTCYVAALESDNGVEVPDPVALAERMWKFLWDEGS